jgi:hypothetical protein
MWDYLKEDVLMTSSVAQCKVWRRMVLTRDGVPMAYLAPASGPDIDPEVSWAVCLDMAAKLAQKMNAAEAGPSRTS